MLASQKTARYGHVAVQKGGVRTTGPLEICVSVYELNRAIHSIYIERDSAVAFRDGDNSILDNFNLSPEEHAALAARDFPKLWALHAHPMILFHLSAVMNPREWYMQNVIPHIRGVPNQFYDFYADGYTDGALPGDAP